MKNKLFVKILSSILSVSIIFTSVFSVSAQSFNDFSYSNNQPLISSSGANINKVPLLPSPEDPSDRSKWLGTLAALFTVIGVKLKTSFDNTINCLFNGTVDNRTSTYINNILNASPNFSISDFANNNNVLSGNLNNLDVSLIKDLNVDLSPSLSLEKYNTNNYFNGGNKNYYTNNNYNSTKNYNYLNYNTTNNTYNVNYTYNNNTYNYDINNIYYDYTNNYYIYNITNNVNISVSNTYNSTIIINPSGDSNVLYYKLPDGSNSLNLTEEEAINGYKTSLSVSSYLNKYDDDDLNFLYHFDTNEYDSAYPISNYSLSIVPNSIEYINSSNSNFNQSLALNGPFNLSVFGDDYDNFYSFRIYPLLNNDWSLKINDGDISSFTSKFVSISSYEEYFSKTLITLTDNTTYILSYKGFYYYFCGKLAFMSDSLLDSSTITNCFLSVNNASTTPNYSKNASVTGYFAVQLAPTSVSGTASITFDNTDPSSYPFFYDSSSKTFTLNYSQCVNNGYLTYSTNNTGSTKIYTIASGISYSVYYNSSSSSLSSFRQYNFINDKVYESSTGNLINANQWNYVSILNDGSVYVNGLDTSIDVNLDKFNISVSGDSITYIDELASFKANRSTFAPSSAYDSNTVYYLSDDGYNNNTLLIQSLISVNSWKFGGIRPSTPLVGDVYCSVDDSGNITSVQQYNGIEWLSVIGSIYYEVLNRWVNAIGYNIFIDNWNYQDINFRADNGDMNVLIKFLTFYFDKFVSKIDDILSSIGNISFSGDGDNITNINNKYDIDIDTNISTVIDASKSYDNQIDISSSDFNLDDTVLGDISKLSEASKGIFKSLDNSGFSIIYLAPLIVVLVGLLL